VAPEKKQTRRRPANPSPLDPATWGPPVLAGLLVAVVLIGCVGLGLFLPDADSAPSGSEDAAKCTYTNPASQAAELQSDVQVTVLPAAGTANFGNSRGTQALDVALQTSAPVDSDVVKGLSFIVPSRLYRENPNLTTVAVKPLAFSAPVLLSPREIGFTICVDGSELRSGSYTGSVSIVGPERFQAQSLSITVNAKNGKLFAWVLPSALVVSFLLLVLKGAADRTDRRVREEVQDQSKDANDFQNPGGRDLRVLTDWGWWIATFVVLALGLAAGYAIYADNPSWGSDALASVIAVAGAVFAPAGLRAVLTPR
jgi:hypothetical protein